MGSVKDLTVLEAPTADELGVGKFTFSDRYSVFDWGEMPDHIPGKGQSLAMMAAYNFEELEKRGVTSHFISLYSKDDEGAGFDPAEPSETMFVKLTRVLPIDNNYAEYQKGIQHFLIPLEIIYRNGAPKGSSLFKKLERARGNEKEFQKILDSLNLDEEPQPGDFFPEPVYDFTTKLESTDRPVTEKQAQRMSGLEDPAFGELTRLARLVNDFITERAEQVGLQHYDGKIETMYNHGRVQLVDVLGTFDENRFLYDGEQVSKETLRQAYKAYQPEWVEAVDQAKKEAAANDDSNWKSYCAKEPEPLPDELITLVSQIYKAGANLYLGHDTFTDVPPLKDLIPELKKQKEQLTK
ncbi:MAG: phosphoribosylaminoimidazolesuccinocarboxamide synthase [Candidatus Marinimicrobia bacterium]|nr:phosphoribosylaminoimidazolesuccinocarboxamide synthase [Candidatus Neomarinimicrobiota bacterium]MCF7829473.1 phosphoribosylaminoimidazolesuccinocarboxamide synthase [Candidatus Neomarinimicrobiota bacterium]MCF7880129.1 phosphoribosylaminoimidazolesuccinocarboxamide synthase [Candidatus Neomarinimicrobiota bacterium]